MKGRVIEMTDIAKLVRNYFEAYETKEKSLLEDLLREDFTFSSPVDDNIDRTTYFASCWPNSENIKGYHIQNLLTNENEAMIRYDCELRSGVTFQNTEYFYFIDNKIKDIVVYFGDDKKTSFSVRKHLEKFNQAFVTGDVDFIIDNVNEDVRWHLVGEKILYDKKSVQELFEPMRDVVAESHRTDNIIVDGDTGVIEGTMKVSKEDGQKITFAFCDIYTFDPLNNWKIKKLTAYLMETSDD